MDGIILISKSEVNKAVLFYDKVIALCECVLERDVYYLYVPLQGKLSELEKLMRNNQIDLEITGLLEAT